MNETIDIGEAVKVSNAVKDDLYPPTNPAVLLAAARSLYLAHQDHAEIRRILRWTLYVMATNDVITTPELDATVALYFAGAGL